MSLGTDSEIAKGVRDIRRARLRVWIVLFGGLPVVLGVIAICSYLFPHQEDTWAGLCFFVWMAAWFGCGFRLASSRCPFCHRYVFWSKNGWYSNLFARKCLRCNLSLRKR